jgi:hypothetical protein
MKSKICKMLYSTFSYDPALDMLSGLAGIDSAWTKGHQVAKNRLQGF